MKLTLSLDQNVIEHAKKYAKNHSQSLSHLVENYLKRLTESDESFEEVDAPVVMSLKGRYKTNNRLNYTDDLTDQLTKKYL